MHMYQGSLYVADDLNRELTVIRASNPIHIPPTFQVQHFVHCLFTLIISFHRTLGLLSQLELRT